MKSSWNEWDPLNEVIVGSARGSADIGYEPALSPFHQLGAAGRAARGGAIPPPGSLLDGPVFMALCWGGILYLLLAGIRRLLRGKIKPTPPCAV